MLSYDYFLDYDKLGCLIKVSFILIYLKNLFEPQYTLVEIIIFLTKI